ncbi:hypothetical protein Q8W71_00615 [Methylobacterium sp. NEAU 140]|uniref:hypothetical protein n=1 Tax=Methylobacterium sp. NEAU 140 TaxID=3064945 RepID=UPI0027339027|nr:hypothetical protein [Methylobacterium sp. NEAU 140]MDP4021112.1 hypothetical protein [Methylobacterium sp. NEAU 140]
MSTFAILAVSACALISWCVLVQAAREVLVARAQPPACPCRDLVSITVGQSPVTTQFSTHGVEALKADLTRMARGAGEVH